MNGTYKLQFENSDYKTDPIPWNAGTDYVKSILEGMNSNFVNRIEVSSSIGLDTVSHSVMFIGVN